MSLDIEDVFFQSVSYKGNMDSQFLYSIRNFKIIDRLVQSNKFQKVIYKKPPS